MVAMLPAGAASVFSLVGLGAGGGAIAALSPVLSPIAQPLLLASTALVAVSQVRCGRLAIASAAAGGTLLYLSMYAITQSNGRAEAALFYPGLALFIASYLIPIVRRRLGRCRPIVAPGAAKALLVATLLAGTVAVGSVAALRGDAGATPTHGQVAGHSGTGMPGMSTGH